MDKYYIINLETERMELHFEKSFYQDLAADIKKQIKSACLFSRTANAWVSRSTKNYYRAESIAKKLGLINKGTTGERLSFSEKMERKQEKAMNRISRFEQYAENAKKRGKDLQREFQELRKDWSWITQPIISGHAGSQRFGRQREKVIRRYEKGFEEFQKAEYFENKAASAEHNAYSRDLENPVFLNRRIQEAKTLLKKLDNQLSHTSRMVRLGIKPGHKGGKPTTFKLSDQEKLDLISKSLPITQKMEEVMEQLNYYRDQLTKLDGVKSFSKEYLKTHKIGYITYRNTVYPVKSFNNKSVTILNWLSIGNWTWLVPYHEITAVHTVDSDIKVLDRNSDPVLPKVKF